MYVVLLLSLNANERDRVLLCVCIWQVQFISFKSVLCTYSVCAYNKTYEKIKGEMLFHHIGRHSSEDISGTYSYEQYMLVLPNSNDKPTKPKNWNQNLKPASAYLLSAVLIIQTSLHLLPRLKFFILHLYTHNFSYSTSHT